MDRSYVEGLIDEGVKSLERADEEIFTLGPADRSEARVGIAMAYAELAKVALKVADL